MIYLNRDIISIDRDRVRENNTLISLYGKKVSHVWWNVFCAYFNDGEIKYLNFVKLCNEVWKQICYFLLLMSLKTKL